MTSGPAPPAGRLSRRRFLGLASSAAVGLWVAPARAAPPGGPRGCAAGGEASAPVLRVPRTTTNGAKVPIVVEMAHPMSPAHHVRTLEILNAADPIPSKGTFHLTPACGRVHLSFQARMHGGISQVAAVAACSGGGRWTVLAPIEIPADAGGCTGTAPAGARAGGDDVRGPVLRVAELVERGRVREGEIVHVQVKLRHPNRTGLVLRDGGFVSVEEPLYLERLDAWFGDELVMRFEPTPALADDPFIGFALRATREDTLRVALRNSRGARFEATHPIRFS